MAISPKLKTFLDKEKISYEVLHHSTAFTAQEVAGAQHIPGKQAIKSVIVKADGKFVMVVLPAIHMLDLKKFKESTHAKEAVLATEGDIAKLFPDYEVGAEPPFGQLYGLDVYADQDLDPNLSVIFNAGTHTDTVRIKYADYLRVVKPKVVKVGKHI
jgi:Ala-tRNA(Pro) deacylase